MKELYTVYNRKNLDKKDGQFIHPVVCKGRFATPEQAQPLADALTDCGESAVIGKYYIFTKKEWRENQYKSKSNDGRKTTIINGEHGTTLIFEGLHFEIEK